MAISTFSAPARLRKSRSRSGSRFSPVSSAIDPARPAAPVPASDAVCAPPLPVAVTALRAAGVEADLFVAILAALEETGGVREIGDLAEAIPDCPRPISAVLALVDAGLLAIDATAPFDTATRVARLG